MNETISGRWSRFLYNSLLLGNAAYAAYCIQYEQHPFAFAACMVGATTALVGLLRVLFGSGQPDECRIVRSIGQILLDVAPLPLVNMDLYMQTQGMGLLVLGHLIFVLPLVTELNCALLKDSDNCETSHLVNDLNALGNIVSLGFLTVMERNWQLARMIVVMVLVRYGAIMVDSIQEGAGENLQLLGNALFFCFLRKSLVQMKA